MPDFLDLAWISFRYETYAKDAPECEACQGIWKEMKEHREQGMSMLAKELKTHMEKGKFEHLQ